MAMEYTRQEVVDTAARAFPAERLETILAILDQYGTGAAERERARVQFAMLTLTGGDVRKLLHCVSVAKTDYRDVLWWAEYPEDARRASERSQAAMERIASEADEARQTAISQPLTPAEEQLVVALRGIPVHRRLTLVGAATRNLNEELRQEARTRREAAGLPPFPLPGEGAKPE